MPPSHAPASSNCQTDILSQISSHSHPTWVFLLLKLQSLCYRIFNSTHLYIRTSGTARPMVPDLLVLGGSGTSTGAVLFWQARVHNLQPWALSLIRCSSCILLYHIISMHLVSSAQLGNDSGMMAEVALSHVLSFLLRSFYYCDVKKSPLSFSCFRRHLLSTLFFTTRTYHF